MDFIVDDVETTMTPKQREKMKRWYEEALADERYEVRTTMTENGSITTIRPKED